MGAAMCVNYPQHTVLWKQYSCVSHGIIELSPDEHGDVV